MLAISVIFTNFVLCNFPPEVVKAQIKSVNAGSDRGAIYSGLPGQAFVVLEDKVKAGDVVAYDSKPFFIYPLWKPDFSNKVIYVPSTKEPDWYKKINQESVDYVFTTLQSKEHDWAENKMTSIYKDEMYEIFKVR